MNPRNILYNLWILLPPTVSQPQERLLVSPHDGGEAIDENELGCELANELAAPLPGSLADAPAPEVDSEEFESEYGWFYS